MRRAKIVILDAETLGYDLDPSILERFGEVVSYHRTDADEVVRNIDDAQIVITNKVVIDEETMRRAPNLELICVAATGTNNIDMLAADRLGIEVRNVKGYSTPSVVQHTFAMLFYLLNKLRYFDDRVKEGDWTIGGIFTDLSVPFHELSGKKWGIIGLGTIGSEVARIATAFGAHIAYHSLSGHTQHSEYIHQPLDLLLQTSDIVSIHAPLTDKSYMLIDETNLPLLKDKAILLNLGRGGIINETDLAYELDRREIYAGLDVLEHEPIASDHPLMHIEHKERLLMTPHIAWASVESRKRLLEGIVANIKSHLQREIS